MFAKVQTFSWDNLDEVGTGHIITRLTNDVVQVERLIAMSLRMLINSPLTLIGSVVMTIIVCPQLTWIMAIVAPFLIVVLFLIITRSYPMFRQVQGKLDDVNTVAQENLAGMRLVKAFNREDYEKEKFGRVSGKLKDVTQKASRIMRLTWPTVTFTMNVGVALALWFGGREVLVGTMAPGQVMAFLNYINTMLMSLTRLSHILSMVARSQASTVRISEILDTEITVPNADNPVLEPPKAGRIEFDDVTFTYRGTNLPVLRNLSFYRGTTSNRGHFGSYRFRQIVLD